MTSLGLTADDQKRVLAGEYVIHDSTTVSERDLSVIIAFLVKASPDAIAKEVVGGDLLALDTQVKATGTFRGTGSTADLVGLEIGAAAAKKLTDAKAGSALNLSKSEITAFGSIKKGDTAAAEAQLRSMLLARYQAYRSKGLSGIAKYDRGGSASDPAADLRKATDASAGLQKFHPDFHKVLVSYPKATVAGLEETLRWIKYDIDGTETYALAHLMVVPDGDARAVVSRQYYVSTGYNAGQAILALLPVEQGTIAIYGTHTFTEQVAGFGGSAKRGIGRKMMESTLEEIFERDRKKLER